MSHPTWTPSTDLHRGITVLEASAGTGKTYQIAHMFARLVAENDLRARQITVVTFTRAAAAELKDRIHRRLHDAATALSTQAPPDDPNLATLAESAGDARTQWATRLVRAATEIDDALITTIHGFCQRILDRYAFESAMPMGSTLLTNTDEVRDELVADWLTATFHDADAATIAQLSSRQGLAPDLVHQIARAALDDAAMPVEPTRDDTSDPVASARADFAAWVRAEMKVRTQQQGVRTFADLIEDLHQALLQDGGGLTAAIRADFRAALIDEFQDTDGTQWAVFQRLFDTPDHWLCLIGDPKQAIYAFRGANVQVYADAVQHAADREGHVYSMDQNFRSDDRLVHALNHVLDHDRVFGRDDIPYVRVRPAHPTRLRWPNEPRPALSARLLSPTSDAPDTWSAITKFRSDLQSRVVADVVDTLSSGAELDVGMDTWRPVEPGDIAILVSKNAEATSLARALQGAGVPAVAKQSQSVFATGDAQLLADWLRAAESPRDDRAARRAAAAPWFGWTAHDLALLDADPDVVDASAAREAQLRWERWIDDLTTWNRSLYRHGFLDAWRTADDTYGITERLLRQPGGDRAVTNLRHLTERIHVAQRERRLHGTGVLAWLEHAIAHADGDAADHDLLRLDRDTDAVQVLTMHKSKGLQFPIVFLPGLCETARELAPRAKISPVEVLPSAADPRDRVLDLRAPDHPDKVAAYPRRQRAAQEERLRIAYVALTRARHHCVVYDAIIKGHGSSPVMSLLHAGSPDTDRLDAATARAEDLTGEQAMEDLRRLANTAEPTAPIAVGFAAAPDQDPQWVAPKRPQPTLARSTFERPHLDRVWGTSSYSAMIRTAARNAEFDDERDLGGIDHDQRVDAQRGDAASQHAIPDLPALPQAAVPVAEVPLSRFPPGAEAGTFLHTIFEDLDFQEGAGSGGAAAIDALLDELTPRYGFDAPEQRAMLRHAFPRILTTPFGGPLGDFCLADLPRSHRLDELAFTFPVAGGDRAGRARVDAADLAKTLAQAAPDGLSDAYLERLSRMDLGRLSGFFTGSIDLVFALDEEDTRRFFVVDYKSNRLDLQRSDTHPIDHFHPAWMQWEMEHHHYVLQYHLYTVALHRYLKHRVDGYADAGEAGYEACFGGVYYLFFRGMIGAEQTPVVDGHRYGVHYRRPTYDVIEALDHIFRAAHPGGVA